jgi:hypothetical protein
MSAFLALDEIDRAIGEFPVGLAVQRDLDRKSARRSVAKDLYRTNGLAPGPLPNGLYALLSESLVAQSDCLGLRHVVAVKVDCLRW